MRNRSEAIKLAATHCIFCNHPLNDPESLERGVGPECNAKYAQPAVAPQPDDVARAMGTLAEFQDVLRQVDSDLFRRILEVHPNGHKIGTELIYTASAHRNEKPFVLALSDAIRQLGYHVAADKMQQDRSCVTLKATDDLTEIHIGYHQGFAQDFYKIPGGRSVRDPQTNKFKHRTIPKGSWQYLITALGLHFNGECALIEGVGNFFIRTPTKDDIDKLNNARVGRSDDVRLILNKEQVIEVYAPFNQDFINDLKTIKGRRPVYDETVLTKGGKPTFVCWTVPENRLKSLEIMVKTHFPRAAILFQDQSESESLDSLNWMT